MLRFVEFGEKMPAFFGFDEKTANIDVGEETAKCKTSWIRARKRQRAGLLFFARKRQNADPL